MTSSVQNIIFAIVTLLVLALGGFLYMSSDDFSLSSSGTTNLDNAVLLNAQIFLSRKAVLDNLHIEDNLSIFTDAKFLSLESNAVPVLNQDVGKSNLFDEAVESETGVSANDDVVDQSE